MNDLLKEAIADAKAVRETALANAKLALEEAFTPRLQSMLSAKLSEEEGIEDEPVAEDEMPMDAAPVEEPVEEPAVEEPVAESDHGYEGEEELAEEEAPEDEPVATEGRGMNDADEDPTDVHSEEADAELEEILRELEGEDEEAPVAAEGRGDDEAVEEQSDSSDIGKGDNKVDLASSSDEEDPGKGKLAETEGEGDAEDVDLEEIIRALKEEDGEEEVTEDQDTAGVDDGASLLKLKVKAMLKM